MPSKKSHCVMVSDGNPKNNLPPFNFNNENLKSPLHEDLYSRPRSGVIKRLLKNHPQLFVMTTAFGPMLAKQDIPDYNFPATNFIHAKVNFKICFEKLDKHLSSLESILYFASSTRADFREAIIDKFREHNLKWLVFGTNQPWPGSTLTTEINDALLKGDSDKLNNLKDKFLDKYKNMPSAFFSLN